MSFVQEQGAEMRARCSAGWNNVEHTQRDWRPGFGGFGPRPTGNSAFDDWRTPNWRASRKSARSWCRPSAISPSISRSCGAPATARNSSASWSERANPQSLHPPQA